MNHHIFFRISGLVLSTVVMFSASAQAERVDTYRTTALGMSPLIYYSFDETSGTVADNLAGTGLDGEYGGTIDLNGAGFFMESTTTAAKLDSTDDYISVIDDGSLDLRRQVSFAFWLKVDSFVNQWATLVWKGDPALNNAYGRTYSMWLRNDGAMVITTADSSPEELYCGAGTIQAGQWYHIAGVINRDSGQMKIFVNGREIAYRSIRTNDSVSSVNPLRIASTMESSSNISPLRGTIDEFCLFGSALNSAQVKSLMQSAKGTCVQTTNPAWIYDLNGGPLTGFTMTFNKTLNFPGTFGPEDLTVLNPANQLLPVTISDLGGGVYQCSFASQTAPGNYRITLDKDFTDADGLAPDLNRNGFPGDSEDRFYFEIRATENPTLYAGAIGCWGFNEGQGNTVFDVSGHNNNGFMINNPQRTTGTAGGAMTFNGSNNYVQVPYDPSMSMTDGITMACWIAPSSIRAAGMICKGVFHEDYALWTESNSTFFAGFNWPEEWARFYSQPKIQAETWMFVAATWDKATKKIRLYINGQPDNESTWNNTITNRQDDLYIAADPPGSWEYYQGKIDEIAIYNRPLSGEEVAGLYTESLWAAAKPDLMAKTDDQQSYTGDNIYDNPAAQTLIQTLAPGMTAVYDVILENDTDLGDITLSGSTVPSGWQVVYLRMPDATDITSQITQSGGMRLFFQKNKVQLEVQVTSPAGATADETFDCILTAQQTLNPAVKDEVVLSNQMKISASVPPFSRTYTVNADFDYGVMNGVGYEQAADQLQLAEGASALPFIWVPNSNDGTISKVDTITGNELGRYHVGPSNANPSRTTVDLYGNCWVGNRDIGTVVKVGLFENGQSIDRNFNGKIDTSEDTNGDGKITGSEILPWGQDECVLIEVVVIPGKEGVYAPGTYTGGYSGSIGARGIAIEPETNNVWAGCRDSKYYYYLDGQTGQILKTYNFTALNHKIYGAVVDENGILWSSGQDANTVLWLDRKTDQYGLINMSHYVYGINIDGNGHLYISGWQNSKISRISVATKTIDWVKPGSYESRGVACTSDGSVWTANSQPGTVTRWTTDGDKIIDIPVGNQPTGVSVDNDGFVWAVNYGDGAVSKIDPATNTVVLSTLIAGNHYGYSDMTGIVSRSASSRVGTWTLTHNAGMFDAPWGAIVWTGDIPNHSRLEVKARSSNDRRNWSRWEVVGLWNPLRLTPPGRYLQVQTLFESQDVAVSPILYDLTVRPSPACGDVAHPYANGDINHDCRVNMQDLAILASDWLTCTAVVCP